jgi:hypothetical protein
LHRAGKFERRLEIEAVAPSDFTEWFFETHEQELEAWCGRLLRRLEDEKIVAS